MDKINELKSIPMHEQRSDAWFKQRENKLTSSDAGTVLGLNPYQKPKDVLLRNVVMIQSHLLVILLLAMVKSMKTKLLKSIVN